MDRIIPGVTGAVMRGLLAAAALAFGTSIAPPAHAQIPVTDDPPVYGPYNGVFLPDGEGLKKALVKEDTVLLADSPWTLYCWVWPQETMSAPSLVAGLGEVTEEYPRYLAAGLAESLSYRQLTRLPAATLSASASSRRVDGEVHIHVQLQNRGSGPALANKLTLLNTGGSRILPAYLTDNYVSLLPGESREIEIDYPAAATQGAPQVSIRGWSLAPMTIPVTAQ